MTDIPTPISLETLRIVNSMPPAWRFFLIQPDGTIQRLNAYGKATLWVWSQKAAALRWARRSHGARVWDRRTSRFVE